MPFCHTYIVVSTILHLLADTALSNVAQKFDAIILGGGAAGLMCAIEAGRRGRKVVVLERADRIGKKILISGGGRCNFTNIHCTPENFLSSNPHFCKSALARYTPEDFLALVQKHRIPYHEKTLGQLFCDRSSLDIVNLLEDECRATQVRILVNAQVQRVDRDSVFVVTTNTDKFVSETLVVATGGLSIPKMGATAFGYQIAKQFGLKLQDCRPALVPLTLTAADRRRYCDLAGVSTEVIASANGHKFREKMLITHRGLSGPAILQVSSYWDHDSSIQIDLAPNQVATSSLRQSPGGRDLANAKSALRSMLPHRLADRWIQFHAPKRWTNHSLEELEALVHRWELRPEGTEGYAKAEVTAGGVDSSELSSTTMESKKIPGLFFIGEVVDVTGQLGGFNFQWAWASGACAGRSL